MNFSDNVCDAIEVRDTVRDLSIDVHSLSDGAARIAARMIEKLELDSLINRF